LSNLYALALRPPWVSLIHLEVDPFVDPSKQVETMHPGVLFVQSAQQSDVIALTGGWNDVPAKAASSRSLTTTNE
jgi:hypothetical protein